MELRPNQPFTDNFRRFSCHSLVFLIPFTLIIPFLSLSTHYGFYLVVKLSLVGKGRVQDRNLHEQKKRRLCDE